MFLLDTIDYYLDRITMYRLILYLLIALVCIAAILGYYELIRYSFVSVLLSAAFAITICYCTNILFSWAFRAPYNVESVYITALIIVLIFSPPQTIHDFTLLGWASIISMSSKYLLAISKKHIFNPAGIAALVTALSFNGVATWWIGTKYMSFFVLIFGLFIMRKLRFEYLIISFFTTAIFINFLFSIINSGNGIKNLEQMFYNSPLLFLGFFMLTEPLTMPYLRYLKIIFGIMVAFLSMPHIHLGNFYFTPELALSIGNLFAYLVSPKEKYMLFLVEKREIGPGIMDFIFKLDSVPKFRPGQYMEWTLPHAWPDSRGNRRYFTIASSPTERNIRLGIKFYENGSTYKKALYNLDSRMQVVGASLSGDFTMPANPNTKLAFIAGGIGITPFRSMIKYLVDTNSKRDIVLFYANKTIQEIVHTDVFNEAREKLGIKTIYTLTDLSKIPEGWKGYKGIIRDKIIISECPDYKERVFYLSGPHAMVVSYENVLSKMGLPSSNIKKDYFPGLV